MKHWIWLVGLGLSAMGAGSLQGATLVPQEADWKYQKGDGEASSPPEAWRTLGFNDDSWATGRAPFYYDNNNQYTGNTVLGDMRQSYTSVFLRHTFNLRSAENIGALELRAICDDGFIVWINGVEVERFNMPGGFIPFDGTAGGAVSEPISFETYPLPDPSDYLEGGDNVIAVQAFNTSLTSSDLKIDVELISVEPDLDPPRITSIDPAPGPVTELNQITVTFNEPVVGVNALDLLLNESSPDSVVGSEAVYTFTFSQPAFGTVHVRWDDRHGIIDTARPANPFDETAEEAAWEYQLVDNLPPRIAGVQPPPGLDLRQFTEIEVTFSEPVTGVNAGDLLVNGLPASGVTGLAAGPFRFELDQPAAGPVEVTWAENHQITDQTDNTADLASVQWDYTLAPDLEIPPLQITEILAANASGLTDEDGEETDWIEVYNPGDTAVSLLGWSLTDDAGNPGQWTFPDVSVGPDESLVVLASGKDRKPTNGGRLHTNFKLSSDGEYTGLYSPELPRQVVSELAPEFPEQRNDYSYGLDPDGNWVYYETPTPGAPNGTSDIEGIMDPPHFSVPRGFFQAGIKLHLSTPEENAEIRYTTDGSEPTASDGRVYLGPLTLGRSPEVVRAAVFKENHLPSRVVTHTYLFNLDAGQQSLPALSVSTDNQNLFGDTGIMETSPRNTTKRGIAWERPVSAELILPEDNSGFQINAGIRIQGGNYVRERYNPRGSLPFRKYSFRLYFRGDYGASQLEYPLFPEAAADSYDKVVLRAGMNDHSNPFIVDELVRRLHGDMGHVYSHGTIVNFYLNGQYKGYYNPTERLDDEFLRLWHGGTNKWDLIAQFGEIQEGDAVQWDNFRSFIKNRNMSVSGNYQEALRRMDMVNFVDYLLVNVYAGMGDWPHNNWRAARERVDGAKWRFYVWDGEWGFGNQGRSVTVNTFTEELRRSADIADFYQSLKQSPEFRLLFADRVQKHMFNGGALSSDHVIARFRELREIMSDVLPDMSQSIHRTWVPQRPGIMMEDMANEGLLAPIDAPSFNRHGGRVSAQFELEMQAPEGVVYYTTNGVDPRVPFTGEIDPSARAYDSRNPVRPQSDVRIKARARQGGDWSALTEATFQVASMGVPLHVTELMYHPVGGEQFEFLELHNAGATPLDVGGFHFEGIEYTFPENTQMGPGATWVLIPEEDPEAFAVRYPEVAVQAHYTGNLSNGGERLILKNAQGSILVSVDYQDDNGWPVAADGGGYSLELIDLLGAADSPANWRVGAEPGGSPGIAETGGEAPEIHFNELMADNLAAVENEGAYPDWIELHHRGETTVDLSGWSLSDNGDPRHYVFPQGTALEPDGYLVIWADTATDQAGLHAGFGLDREGEHLFLYDAQTNRVDAMSYGGQITDLSLGWFSGSWQLGTPTPGTANETAEVASPTELTINEWMADSLPGEEDWLELYNQSPDRPVALEGLYLTTDQAIDSMGYPEFIAPGGYLRLWADEQPGTRHLDFRLPAAGGAIGLHQANGIEIDRVDYGTQVEGVSQGRLPDGGSSILNFTASASPGAGNYIADYTGPHLNEIMAWNRGSITDENGRASDWVELYNPNAEVFDLTGMSLSIGEAEPGQWMFPTGSEISGRSHVVLWCEGSRPGSSQWGDTVNVGRSLNRQGGGIYLFNADGQLVDSVEYGFQLADQTIGLAESRWQLLADPSPGEANGTAASLDSADSLRLNEWMAAPQNGPDWFEIYNPASQPVRLTGLYLSDDPSLSGRMKFSVPALSFIGPGQWVQWIADGQSGQPGNQVNFRLDQLGEVLAIYNSGLTAIDMVDFGMQSTGVSQGRLPDGADEIVSFEATPSPEASNYRPIADVVINEVLTHSDLPLEDAVELANLGDQAVEIGGWYLSDASAQLKKYRIPDGTTLPAGGFVVFYENQFNGGAGSEEPFSLNSSRGDEIYLSAADQEGNLTGQRSQAVFGPAANGVSIGRYETSVETVFVAQQLRTFGMDDPDTVEAFRQGAGSANSGPWVSPVVINEVMYHPPEAQQAAGGEEFIELYNRSGASVDLFDSQHPENRWSWLEGIEFEFSQNTSLAAGDYLLMVEFDPETEPARLSAFRSHYGVPESVPVFGPYTGQLANNGERIGLYQPDPPQTDGPDAGFVPYVLVEALDYGETAPWPTSADGQGKSLQRLAAGEFGNDPANWQASDPTPGSENGVSELDEDGDGLPDSWEEAHGLDPGNEADAESDLDGDGFNNREEYQSGTDPEDNTSYLRVARITRQGGNVTLQFEAKAGRSYSIWYRDSLTAGQWEPLAEIEAEAGDRMVDLSDLMSEEAGQRYYRLVTRMTP